MDISILSILGTCYIKDQVGKDPRTLSWEKEVHHGLVMKGDVMLQFMGVAELW